jgi:hypothetical protein
MSSGLDNYGWKCGLESTFWATHAIGHVAYICVFPLIFVDPSSLDWLIIS